MRKHTSMKKVNDFIDMMLDDGWTVERVKKHVILRSPRGRVVTIGKTIRDAGHGAANTLGTLKRYWREHELQQTMA